MPRAVVNPALKKAKQLMVKNRPKGLNKKDDGTVLKDVLWANLPQTHQAFLQHLMEDKDFNLSEAAKKAGLSMQALTRNEQLARALSKAINDRMYRCEVSADRVLRELCAMAFSNPKDIVDESGRVRGLHELPDEVAKMIKKVRVTEKKKVDEEGNEVVQRLVEYEFHDKLNAVGLLMRHLGLNQPTGGSEAGNKQVSLAGLLEGVEEKRELGTDYIKQLAASRVVQADGTTRQELVMVTGPANSSSGNDVAGGDIIEVLRKKEEGNKPIHPTFAMVKARRDQTDPPWRKGGEQD